MCGIGQARDSHGNCEFCPTGFFQPTDYRPESIQNPYEPDGTYDFKNHYDWLLNQKNTLGEKKDGKLDEPVTCSMCKAGTFANKLVEYSQFDQVPKMFSQVCRSITASISLHECEGHSQTWHPQAGRLVFSNIPRGLKVALSGEVEILSEEGGSFLIVYETYNLNHFESFRVYVDGKVVVEEKHIDMTRLS